jgi:hypothetical protein
MSKSRHRRKQHRRTRRPRMRGGRLAGHVNPGIFRQETQHAMHLLREVEGEQGGVPRFNNFKILLEYILTTQEILKNKVFRDTIRRKLNEFYGEGHNYINADKDYAELVQQITNKINDLDARGVRHKIIN